MNLLMDGDPVHMTLRLFDDEVGPFSNNHILEYKGTEAHFDGCRMDTLYKRHDSNVGAWRLKMTWWCEPSSSPMPPHMPAYHVGKSVQGRAKNRLSVLAPGLGARPS